MKYGIYVILLLVAPLIMRAQESNSASENILKYYKIASPEDKQYIDSLCLDFETKYRAYQIKSICNVDFGMSRENALSILRNKYGTPAYNPHDNDLSFENVKYAGIDFERVLFLFQSDGRQSYLNGCIFIKRAKNRSEAEQVTELYRSALSRKYDLYETVDDNGFKVYQGGISPMWDGKWQTLLESLDDGKYFNALHTDVIEYDSELVRDLGCKYGVRLIYGPFDYVKEEF